MINNIQEMLVIYTPTITAILSMIAAFFAIVKNVKDNTNKQLKIFKEENNITRNEYLELKKEVRYNNELLQTVLTENAMLKRQNRELKEAITRIKQPKEGD